QEKARRRGGDRADAVDGQERPEPGEWSHNTAYGMTQIVEFVNITLRDYRRRVRMPRPDRREPPGAPSFECRCVIQRQRPWFRSRLAVRRSLLEPGRSGPFGPAGAPVSA